MSAHSSITHNSPQSGNNPKGPSTDVYTNIHTMEYYSTVKRNEVLPHATSEQPWKIFCVYLVTQSCPTLCKPMDCNPSGSSLHGIFQARILEWVTICYSRGSSPPRDRTCISCISCIWQAVSLPLHHLGNPLNKLVMYKKILTEWFLRAFISAKWSTSKADCFLTKVSIHFQ